MTSFSFPFVKWCFHLRHSFTYYQSLLCNYNSKYDKRISDWLMSSLFHCLVHTGPAQMSDQSLRSSLPALLGAVAVSKVGCRFPSIARIFASRAESVTRPEMGRARELFRSQLDVVCKAYRLVKWGSTNNPGYETVKWVSTNHPGCVSHPSWILCWKKHT